MVGKPSVDSLNIQRLPSWVLTARFRVRLFSTQLYGQRLLFGVNMAQIPLIDELAELRGEPDRTISEPPLQLSE